MSSPFETTANPYMIVHPARDPSKLAVRALDEVLLHDDLVVCGHALPSQAEAEALCARLAREHGLMAIHDPRVHEIELRERAGDEVFYLAVLSRNEITVAQARWFDIDDYTLASGVPYKTHEEANEAAAAIADHFGLPFSPYLTASASYA